MRAFVGVGFFSDERYIKIFKNIYFWKYIRRLFLKIKKNCYEELIFKSVSF